MTQTFNDNVVIEGSQDIDQLRVQGHTTQTQSLQTWENSASSVLAEMTSDGRLILGDDVGGSSPDSLIEAHRNDTSPNQPKRAFHALGRISNALTEIAQWIVQELEIRGTAPLSALQTALRIRATNMNTGTPTIGGEIRAADIEVINDITAGNAALPKATALQLGVTNALGKTITQATGLHIKMSNEGTITTPYAIYTEGTGAIHLEDYIEIKSPLSSPTTPPTNYIRVYPKPDGKLYAKNWSGTEFDLTSGVGGATAIPSLCNGRLTVASGTPVTTSDLASGTLYFTPYEGNQVALFTGTTWNVLTFTEISLNLSALTSHHNHDIFLYDNAGTLTLEAVAWSNNTIRATPLVRQDAIYVKSGATTRRYLGTIRTTVGQTIDTFQKRFVYNESKPVMRKVVVKETTGSWTYGTNAWRPANNNSANCVEIVVGNVGTIIDLNLACRMHGGGAGSSQSIGYDSTTSSIADLFMSCSTDGNISGHLVHNPTIGYHYYQWIENGRGSTSTYYGFAAGGWQSGLNGYVVL